MSKRLYRVIWKTWGSNSTFAKRVNTESETEMLSLVNEGLKKGYHIAIHDNNFPEDKLIFGHVEED